MKIIKSVLISIVFIGLLSGCRKAPIGFLTTEYASYEIDSLVVKTVLDTTPPLVMPNPEYEMLLQLGFNSAQLIAMGIYPTVSTGGGEDYDRHRLGIPWVSTPIEGVEGTLPITANIENVTTNIGDISKLLQQITVYGNGVFSIPVTHDISPGRYVISLKFTNEGYSKSLKDIFTIIVK